MSSILTLLIYYWIITLSLIGYGMLFNKFFLKNFDVDIGFIGIYGIFSLLFISYISSLFLPHSELFNTIVLIIGLINLFISKNIIKKDLKKLLIVFGILMIFIFVYKNHDDFSYYHFPYAHLLSEFPNMVGLGNFNHGFRTQSSIFYLSSLFNLPFTNYFLLHLSPVFFMGFANIIFYNKILESLGSKKSHFILFLSLLSLIFINIFFYRLAEHGTDRSAMILIMVTIVELIYLTNINKNINKNSFLRSLILITIIISLKSFYILYCLLIIPVIFYFNKNKTPISFFFKNIVTYLCLIFVFLILLVNFFNSGCLIYPVKILCFDSFSWSIPISEVELMKNWYQQWAKAGASPTFRVDNPELYIKDFNWVGNWIDKYFFNKVSDFLLGLIFLCLLVWLFVFSKKIQKIQKVNFWIIYVILIFLICEWFYLHPSLRYGGYHLIALLLFIPLSNFLTRYSVSFVLLRKRVSYLILLTIIVFFSRNISRLYKEYQFYGYNIFHSSYYRTEGQNFSIFKKINKINKCNIQGDLTACTSGVINGKYLNNSYIYYKEK